MAACGGPAATPTPVAAPAPAPAPVLVPAPVDPGAPIAIPAEPAARPHEVVADFGCGDPRGQLVQLALFADVVESGAGAIMGPDALATLLGELTGGGRLEGLDLGRPLHILLVRTRPGELEPVVVVGLADEAATLASITAPTRIAVHAGHAAIGMGAAVRLAAPWALSARIGEAIPPELRGSITGAAAMDEPADSLATLIAAFALQGLDGDPGAQPAVERLVAMLRQVDRIDGALIVDRDHVDLQATLVARADSTFAGFVAAQRPTDFAYAAHLQPGPFPIVAAGELAWVGVEDALGHAIRARLGFGGLPTLGLSGWLAVGGDRSSVEGFVRRVTVKGVADAAARAAEQIGTVPAQIPADATRVAGSRRARGTTFYEVATTPPVGAPTSTFVGGKGDALWVLGGARSRAIAWLKARPELGGLGGAIAAAISAARSRKDSALIAIDLLPEPSRGKPATAPAIALGLGFAGREARLSASIPAAQLAAAFR